MVDDLPHLSSLMSAYFNQDFGLFEETDEEALAEYASTTWDSDVDATIAEIDELLQQSSAGVLNRFREATGHSNVVIGSNDMEAREWLEMARKILSETPSPSRTSC